MAEPEEVPVVTVGGMGSFGHRAAGHVLATLCEEAELVLEVDVPVGIVFYY